MTAALEVGEWSAARPGRTLPPGKTRYPFYRRLEGPQGRSGLAENLVPTGIRSRPVQPVVSHYIDWATRTTTLANTNWNQRGYLKLTTGFKKGLHATASLFSELQNVLGVQTARGNVTVTVILKLLALWGFTLMYKKYKNSVAASQRT